MNFKNMLKQVQEMQTKLMEVQNQLEKEVVEGDAGGGVIKATVNGKGDLLKIKIDKSLLDPEETEVLEDLVVAAVQNAKNKAQQRMTEEMSKLTGGLPLGNFKLPF